MELRTENGFSLSGVLVAVALFGIFSMVVAKVSVRSLNTMQDQVAMTKTNDLYYLLLWALTKKDALKVGEVF
ncbi:MAG: hypothetical protein R3B45_13415 [Bdellovibrionota bacterium]